MAKGDKFVEILSQPIKEDYDKTYFGYIIEVLENNNYKVKVNGSTYTLFSQGVFIQGDKVSVIVPQNNWNKIYIDFTPETEYRPKSITFGATTNTSEVSGSTKKGVVTVVYSPFISSTGTVGEITRNYTCYMDNEDVINVIRYGDSTAEFIKQCQIIDNNS